MSRKRMPRRPIVLLIIVTAILAFFPIFFKIRSSLFPVNYRQLVFATSNRHDIDPLLITAIIIRESHFRPLEISPQGDYGMMQIQPLTLLELERVKLINKGQYQVNDLLDPKINIEVGVLYLKYLSQKILKSPVRMQKINNWYAGDIWPVVLAAYNAGPTVVFSQILDSCSSKLEFERTLRAKRLSTVHYVEDILRYYRSLQWMDRLYGFEIE